MVNDILMEICIGNISDAVLASKYPIDRIELNTALELGGLSPSLETLKYLKKHIEPKICCMVRPRGGDFVYDETEYETMLKDAESFLKEGADGIVFGFLHEDRSIDVDRTIEMTELAHSYGKEAVFHKAFDETEDLEDAAYTLIRCGIDRILTGGGKDPSELLAGCKEIGKLNQLFKNEIEFLPGGGVRVDNVQDVLRLSGSGQVHMTSKKKDPGGYLRLDEEQLQEMIQKIGSL
ncbi:MAG: copper homeostasis protein CutC [Erysipelotrichaceae bacterium]|nr:copper homeostasis protein CutC [Erysipelotrichaceae bacterium]